MKMRNLQVAFVLIVLVSICGCSNTHQIKNDQLTDAATVRSMIESQNFVFVPRFVNAAGVRNRDLGSGFEIWISKDSIISYLPFFGRGYTAPISPADVDFDFTSTKFTYTTTPDRRGWNILIKPKDQRYLQELYFRIFENSSASLTITSNDRSSISYNGYITERKLYTKPKKG